MGIPIESATADTKSVAIRMTRSSRWLRKCPPKRVNAERAARPNGVRKLRVSERMGGERDAVAGRARIVIHQNAVKRAANNADHSTYQLPSDTNGQISTM